MSASTPADLPPSGVGESYPMPRARRGVGAWLTSTDHKDIGLLYILTGFAYFLVAISLAMLMRTQLIVPNNTLLSPERYNQVFTMHGTTMIFLFAMPVLVGFANYLVPLMIGARDMVFPRLNALSYWLFAVGGVFLYSSFLFGGAPDTGWFSYAPLTESVHSPGRGVDFWVLAILLLGASSIAGSVNMIVTMMRLRAPGMTLRGMPMFAFATFVNSWLILAAMPSLTLAVSMLFLDRHFGTSFFLPPDGDPVLWQHLFWFFGHPEVYILILPAFGMMSEVVPVFSRKPLFGRTTMEVMIILIGFFGFLVWAHHMFAVGENIIFNAFFAGTSMIIAVPTGVKIFNWLATMWGGSLRLRTPLLFACGFIALFTIGGLTGVTVAVVPFDWQVTDTYYVVGHFHSVLFGGTLFAVFAGIYYWFPKLTGRLLDDRLGKVNFWLFFFGFLLTFMPLYVVGLLGMPRRVYTYAPDLGWNGWNLASTIGGYVIATALVVFLVNAYRSLRSGQVAGNDPWDAWTLEWATTSPPSPGNFPVLPTVQGSRPLWDLKHPDRADYLAQDGEITTLTGRTRLPEEEAPVPRHAERASTSAAPVLVALGLVTVAIGGVGRSPVVVALGGVFVLGSLIAWAWQRWEVLVPAPAGIPTAEQPTEPSTATIPSSGSIARRGIVVFIASETIFFGVMIAAYVHLRSSIGTWPPPGLPSLEIGVPLLNTVILLTSGLTAHVGLEQLRRGREGWFRVLVILTVVLGASFLGIQAYEYGHVGFSLSSGVMGSTFFTLTGFHGAHVIAGVLVLLLMLAGSWGAKVLPTRRGLAEGGILYWHFVDAVWIAILIAVYLW